MTGFYPNHQSALSGDYRLNLYRPKRAEIQNELQVPVVRAAITYLPAPAIRQQRSSQWIATLSQPKAIAPIFRRIRPVAAKTNRKSITQKDMIVTSEGQRQFALTLAAIVLANILNQLALNWAKSRLPKFGPRQIIHVISIDMVLQSHD